MDQPTQNPSLRLAAPSVAEQDVEDCVRLLKQGPFAIWAGFGATESAHKVRELVKRTGAKIFCSPRAKGIFPETHPDYLGVTGLGGHEAVTEYMLQKQPQWVLVLGTRLGEATSFWDRDLQPNGGFIHVDLDSTVPGTAYPDVETLGIQAEIGHFIDALLQHFPSKSGNEPINIDSRRNALPKAKTKSAHSANRPVALKREQRQPVRPQVVMDAIQTQVVDQSNAMVLAECGNSFAWCNHYLRFDTPNRYRVSTLFGSMGHTATGVVGAALASKDKAVAVVGDGSMLMNSEISSAVQYGAQAVWIVLNDAAYGMCRDGHQALGLTDSDVHIPRVDFTGLAQALGADGMLVEREDQVETALETAMQASGPFVIDIRIDPEEASPLLKRFESLIKQGNSKNVAGWER